MNETLGNLTCNRAEDLISFLYGETDERKARDFRQHLTACPSCKNEFASFGKVRDSIALWKTEAFSATQVSTAPVPVRERSAIAALREFFVLSPLWMKGAVSFAAVVFCVMTILMVNRTSTPPTPGTINNEAKYTEEQMQDALAHQARDFALKMAANEPQSVKPAPEPFKNRRVAPANQPGRWASRRPLSKAEREQLAADLRLLSTRDEDTLNLLSDRINEEF